MEDIPLQNGKSANFMTTNYRLIPELNKKEPTAVHIYGAPCPVCEFRNPAYSYDGIAFAAFQIVCRECGVFYRPVVSRAHMANINADSLVINQMNKPEPEPPAESPHKWRGGDEDDKW